jgi:phage gp16-like protein
MLGQDRVDELEDEMSKQTRNTARNKLIAKIKIGQKQIGLSDDDYRAMLSDRYDVESSTQLTDAQLGNLIQHMERLGFQPIPSANATARKLADDRQSKMIRGIWLELHQQGVVRNPSEQALAAYVKRQTGVERLEWLTMVQASNVIESLKAWRDRL